MLKKLRIGQKLSAGFGMILIILVGLCTYALYETRILWQNSEELYDHPFVVSNAIREIKAEIYSIDGNLKELMDVDQDISTDKIAANFIRSDSNIYKNFDKIYDRFLGSPRDIDAMYFNFNEWKNIRAEILYLARQDNHREAKKLKSESANPKFEELMKRVNFFSEFAHQKAIQFHAEADRSRRSTQTTMLILFFSTLMLSVFISIALTRNITVPLSTIVEAIGHIAKGETTNRLEVTSKDEIGALAHAFNQMQDSFKTQTEVAEAIAAGNLQKRIKERSPDDIVAKSINRIADNLSLIIDQANAIAYGDFSSNITAASDNDQLGTALAKMLGSLREVVTSARKIASGDYSGSLIPKSENDELAISLNKMTASLREVTSQNQLNDKLKTGQNELNIQLRGEQNIQSISQKIVRFLAEFCHAQLGVIYVSTEDGSPFSLMASYAFTFRKGDNLKIEKGEGLLGQAAVEQEIIGVSDLPADYYHINSGLGNAIPGQIILVPLVYEKVTLAVIELGFSSSIGDEYLRFLNDVRESLAIALNTCMGRQQLQDLLAKTRAQAEELQSQQEELKQTNEELETQTQALKKSEQSLQAQQEELRVTNEELEEKTKNLEDQKNQIQHSNNDLKRIRTDLEAKARELEITSKYKSEFLANMSHELRTPLNSLLILSQNLLENRQKNLSTEQVESAEIINKSGKDLLNLINEILDLSKIESGKMELNISTLPCRQVAKNLEQYFKAAIKEKNLKWEVDLSQAPESIDTDGLRLEQILRNLLSNALKFTHKGSIKFTISETTNSQEPGDKAISFSVSDTGIGIPEEKQLQIFEAFQQVDGSISRKYGGTGLGLSISRELARLLHGQIKLQSKVDQGSTFTLTLPPKISTDTQEPKRPNTGSINTPSYRVSAKESEKSGIDADLVLKIKSIPDDRNSLEQNEKAILIIEDDNNFAGILKKLCHKKDLKCLNAATGEEGLRLAEKYLVAGVILDLHLPGMNGWDVLDQLKNNPKTRHIPVHIISADEASPEVISKGAIGFLSKPVSSKELDKAINQIQEQYKSEVKNLLLIEDDKTLRKGIISLLQAGDIKIAECESGEQAIDLMKNHHFDCAILDLGLPDMSGLELLDKLEKLDIPIPPIVVNTGRDISKDETDQLQKYTGSIIIKGVKSQERLLDETSLFLHRVVDKMPVRQRKMLTSLYDKDQMFRDKKILLVDDDMRNVFALTQLLETNHMKVTMAKNGRHCLEILREKNDFDLILMDIMMPEMNGYEAIEAIRKNPKFSDLPIIAITAKAMKEDRDKCLIAGANDYLSKPIESTKLFNLMRVWLYQ